MSRIGKRIITVPDNVNVEINDNKITVKGPKGELSLNTVANIVVKLDGNALTVEKTNDDKFTNAMHGTTNANLKNMIIGVSEGYKKGLEINGVGYRFTPKGNTLTITTGFSHPVNVEVPNGLTVSGISNTEIAIEGIDKCQVSEFAAKIRDIRKPEPYKGKGIKYVGEHIRRKDGKKASK